MIRELDAALRRLYHIDPPCEAVDFLFSSEQSSHLRGAVLVKRDGDDVQLRIFLNNAIREQLNSYSQWRPMAWSTAQLDAFSVAAEEMSHFHYLLYQMSRDREVSQLELEFQGEVDRFLLTYFANTLKEPSKKFFEVLFERLFENYRLEGVSGEDQERYRKANRLAAQFVLKYSSSIQSSGETPLLWDEIRRFYRADMSEMLRFLSPSK